MSERLTREQQIRDLLGDPREAVVMKASQPDYTVPQNPNEYIRQLHLDLERVTGELDRLYKESLADRKELDTLRSEVQRLTSQAGEMQAEVDDQKAKQVALVRDLRIATDALTLLQAENDRLRTDTGKAYTEAECQQAIASHMRVLGERIRKLESVLRHIEDDLSMRYDGAPDSTTRWMGEHLSRIEQLSITNPAPPAVDGGAR